MGRSYFSSLTISSITTVIICFMVLVCMLPHTTTSAIISYDDLCNTPELVYSLTVYDDKYKQKTCECNDGTKTIDCLLLDEDAQCSNTLDGSLCACSGVNCVQRVERFHFKKYDTASYELESKTTCDRCLSRDECTVDEICVVVSFDPRGTSTSPDDKLLGTACELGKLSPGENEFSFTCKSCKMCTNEAGILGIEYEKCFGRTSEKCETDEAFAIHPFQIDKTPPPPYSSAPYHHYHYHGGSNNGGGVNIPYCAVAMIVMAAVTIACS